MKADGLKHEKGKGQIKRKYIRRVRNIKLQLNGGNIILDFNWKAVKRKYIRRVRNILKLQLNWGNIILDFNWKAVSIVRYGAGMESQAEQR